MMGNGCSILPERARTEPAETLDADRGVHPEYMIDANDAKIGVIGDHTRIGSMHLGNIQQVYQISPPPPVDKNVLSEARQRLEEIPVDDIPEPSSLPPGSRIPFGLNPLFVGRREDLLWLARNLKEGQTAAIGQIAAATGLGGIGKTQLAVEFAHRYGPYFAGGVHWLSLADPAAIPAEIVACGLPGHGGLDFQDQLRLVLSAWQSPLPRLLVFDNCEDEQLLCQWRPTTGGSRVLVTSRKGTWDDTAGIAARQIGVLSRQESIALLKKFRPTVSDDDAGTIAEELGDLPLALHLAGSFLKRYQMAPDDYRRQLRDQSLLDHPSLQGRGLKISPTDHESHVGRTFALSYGGLDPAEPIDQMAIALLKRAACFAPGIPIPQALLLKTLGTADPDETLDHIDACNRLIDLGLIEMEAEEALTLHRLLADFVLTKAEDSEAREAVEQTLIEEAGIINDLGVRAPTVAWQAHLRWMAKSAQERYDEKAAAICNALGFHLNTIGDYEGAKPLFEKALTILDKIQGPDHLDTVRSLNNLGMLMHSMGNYELARCLLERALTTREKVLGPDHPLTAGSLNNLGHLLSTVGDYLNAKRVYERALAIREKTLGPEHPDTASSLNNLGILLKQMGDYQCVKPYYERALAIYEKALGPEHPDTASCLNNFGMLLHSIGDYRNARPHYERALMIREKVLGSEHPDTALSLNNLGGLMYAMGDYKGAKPHYERALTIREKVLGPNHPYTAQSLTNFGMLMFSMGDHKGARPLLERALAVHEKALGPEHPTTADSLNNIGLLLSSMGDYESALPCYERALAIYEKALGLYHPNTAFILNNLGMLLHSMGDYQGACTLLERVLKVSQKAWGPDHPVTASSFNSLGMVMHSMGDYVGAKQNYERAASIHEKALGPDHPDTASNLNNRGMLMKEMGDCECARRLLQRALTICVGAFGPEHTETKKVSKNLDALISSCTE